MDRTMVSGTIDWGSTPYGPATLKTLQNKGQSVKKAIPSQVVHRLISARFGPFL